MLHDNEKIEVMINWIKSKKELIRNQIEAKNTDLFFRIMQRRGKWERMYTTFYKLRKVFGIKKPM